MGKRSKAKRTGSKSRGLRRMLGNQTSKTIDVEPTGFDTTPYKDKPAPKPYRGNAGAVPATSSRRAKITHYR